MVSLCCRRSAGFVSMLERMDVLTSCIVVDSAGMARRIHGPNVLNSDGEIINARRMDSQAKHGVIARGGAEFYVRLPKPGYVEWIWDHAAGNVVIEEAGGQMTDTNGQSIDFSLGAKLSPNVRGVLMSNGGAFHQALVSAFAEEEAERLQGTQ
jgi:3'-phosphoadenosine 5'-phosphosulfate (PAPS) 3'-phosphatase